ncbi:ABC transporter substrate-binding protein [Citricoccus sp. I39-566]|uniref:ABC transporter substrate-binding protein n=1 Tax=Citricoccus sp. I39-566 TaxID=3073268 RepID=UPI00286B64AB|nr:ABC transporter substrate-binding protein [Citricoccus sp. I39-566]WMY78342.1 ABC transporter substrate-binding protein [Citricoccus sp. I39-566]
MTPSRTRRRPAATAAVAAVLGAGALTLSGCALIGPQLGGATAGEADPLVESLDLVNPGQLTVCSDIPYPPFEFQQGNDLVGYDIDIVQRIADDLGVRLSVVDSSFEAIESGSSLTGCDVNASSISITEARQQVMAFSVPYLDDDLVLVAEQGSGITDLQSAQGQRVGVQAATTGERFAEENGLSPIQFEDGGMQMEALRAGTVQAVLGNQSVVLYNIKDDPNYEVVAELPTGEQLGVSVAPDKAQLLSAVNASLAGMEEDGSLDESRARWFGDSATEGTE